MNSSPAFKSYIMAGFECTSALVSQNERLDMLTISDHRYRCVSDYRLIKELGITTVREGFSWAQIDQGNGRYDFSGYENMLQTGSEMEIQQIWDLNHFDYPTYLDPFTDEFISAFARYSIQVIKVLKKYIHGEIYLAPINEISFFAWIAADQGKWAPFKNGSDWGLLFKKQLVKAALASMKAIWSVDSTVRFIHIDPFMRRVAKKPATQAAMDHVNHFNQVIRYEAWDMISGRTYPELGGEEKFLDIIGVNYYLHNQEWVISNTDGNTISHRMMSWNSPYRIPISHLLHEINHRYQRPLVITETGSYGNNREVWWERTLREVKSIPSAFPLHGVCIYPTLDRPATVNFLLPHSGIYDFDHVLDSTERIAHEPSLNHIRAFTSSRSFPK
jgi:beta-glucosidase/6-phospho-beta-glucosidase/beta-galactosidase